MLVEVSADLICRRHVIRPLAGVPVWRAPRRQPVKRVDEIQSYVRIGVFLDRQRRRGVTDEKREQSVLRMLAAQPCTGFARYVRQSGPGCRKLQHPDGLCYRAAAR